MGCFYSVPTETMDNLIAFVAFVPHFLLVLAFLAYTIVNSLISIHFHEVPHQSFVFEIAVFISIKCVYPV